MADFGFLPEGFRRPDFDEIRASVIRDLRGRFGNIATGAESVFGQLIGALSERSALWWEGMESTAAAWDPRTATGAQLDGIAALTGMVRKDPQPAIVQVTVLWSANAGTALYAGDIVIDGEGNEYRLLEDLGTWNETTGVPAEALELGDIAPALGEATAPTSTHEFEILAIVVRGTNLETDAELRRSIMAGRPTTGLATVDGIETHVGKVAGVRYVRVVENLTDEQAPSGLLPNEIAVLVVGGASQAIFDAVRESKGASIRIGPEYPASGINVQEGVSTDENGTVHVMRYVRPEVVPVYVCYDLTTRGPVDHEAIKRVIVEQGQRFGPGDDVLVRSFYCAIYAQPNVIDGVIRLSRTDGTGYTEDNLAMSQFEMPSFDASQISEACP